jgi:hypothetical protein
MRRPVRYTAVNPPEETIMSQRSLYAALLLLALSAQSGADDAASPVGNSILRERHVLSVGIADQRVDARIRATADGFDPIGLDIQDLGVDNNDTSYYVDYRYRFKPRWAVIGGVYSFNGAGGRASRRDFNFDGAEYEAGAAIRADFDIDAYIVDVIYTVHRSESVEFAVGGGLHALDLGASISAEVRLDDESVRGSASGATLLAPVPNLRASAIWAVSERFTLHAVAGWLSANIDEYSGDFIYGHLRAMYQFSDSFGIALGYQRTEVNVTQERERSELSFDAELYGPTLTLTYSF